MIASLVLFGVFLSAAAYRDTSSPGMMNPYHWQMIRWLGENTPERAKVLFFYGDIYNQDAVLWPDKRESFVVEPPEYVAALQNRSIRRQYYAEFIGASDVFRVRKSFFGFAGN